MEVYIREFIRACEAYGWESAPEFNTRIDEMANKREKRNAQWSQSRFSASLPFLNIRPETYNYILDMFEDRMGRWGVFLYNNPLKDRVTAAEFAVAEASETSFQLGIMVGQPGRQRRRDVYALYVPELDSNGEATESDITIYVDGVETSAVTLDYDRGTVVFDSPPGAGAVLTWSGRFSHWVRFDQDRLPFSIDSKSGDEYVLNGSVDLIGVPPPRVEAASS